MDKRTDLSLLGLYFARLRLPKQVLLVRSEKLLKTFLRGDGCCVCRVCCHRPGTSLWFGHLQRLTWGSGCLFPGVHGQPSPAWYLLPLLWGFPWGSARHSKLVRNAQLTPNNRKHIAEQHRHLGAPCCSYPQLGGWSEERGVHNEKHLLQQLSIVFCVCEQATDRRGPACLTSDLTSENPKWITGSAPEGEAQPGCPAWKVRHQHH